MYNNLNWLQKYKLHNMKDQLNTNLIGIQMADYLAPKIASYTLM